MRYCGSGTVNSGGTEEEESRAGHRQTVVGTREKDLGIWFAGVTGRVRP